jgi:hypothetical protein
VKHVKHFSERSPLRSHVGQFVGGVNTSLIGNWHWRLIHFGIQMHNQ